MFFPFSILFFCFLFFGSFLSLSSSFWLCIWLGLEINLMSFIPLIISVGSFQEVESSIKYFVVQAFGSGFFLFGGFFNSLVFSVWGYSFFYSFFSFFVFFGLFLKLGVAPFHSWFVSVMGGSGWLGCLLLVVWQKIAPLFLLFWCFSSFFSFFFILFSTISSFIGGLGGINQVQVRLLLAYSSVNHLGWIISLVLVSYFSFFFYFFSYFCINISVFFCLYFLGFSRLSSFFSLSSSFFFIFFLILSFICLAGIPPFFGFIPKMFSVQDLVSCGFIYLCFFLILGSLLSLFFYLGLIFSSFFLFGSFFISDLKYSFIFFVSFLFVLVCFGFLFFEFFFFIFYALVFFY